MIHKSKLPNIEITIFAVMSSLANEYNALNLSQGYPNFKGDQKLFDLVTKAMNSGLNQYAHMAGNLDLRNAIAKKTELLYSTTYDPETEITVTVGALKPYIPQYQLLLDKTMRLSYFVQLMIVIFQPLN